MRSAPPEVVATWPKPNYVNPQARGPDLIVAGLVTLVFAIISLLLRMYVRIRIMRKTDWDDWFMVLAAVSRRRDRQSVVSNGGDSNDVRPDLHHGGHHLHRPGV